MIYFNTSIFDLPFQNGADMSDIQTSSPYLARQQQLATAIQAAGLDAMALNPGPSLVYLTGLHFHLSERPVVAIFIPGADPVIVLPELEAAKVRDLTFAIRPVFYGEDPSTWGVSFQQAGAMASLGLHPRLGAEPRGLRFLELRLLEHALDNADFIPADHCVASLRMHKDAIELDAMRKAVQIAQRALLATLSSVKIGITERELAAELTLQTLRHGSDPELPFAPIVSGGPNSANPHAVPTNRALQAGDLLVIDWGAAWQGYFSDLTRTFAIGKPDPEMTRITRLVAEANAAGRGAARPGVAAGAVDAATRSIIEKGGYGAYFTHRTGHGLGMEGHEEPYIRAGNLLVLAPGMTFTVEPGIYLPECNGVRIEDNVVITATSVETLSNLPRDLIVLG
jgi:Xaa-Pro dipeptidase